MEPASGDDQNESTETPWPRVLQIASSDEFEQGLAVAQLAVKLWELKKANFRKGVSCRERFGDDLAASKSVHPRTNEKMKHPRVRTAPIRSAAVLRAKRGQSRNRLRKVSQPLT
jgi:hypothetical protein